MLHQPSLQGLVSGELHIHVTLQASQEPNDVSIHQRVIAFDPKLPAIRKSGGLYQLFGKASQCFIVVKMQNIDSSLTF